ncbi:flippase [Pseudomonas sp. CCC2.2]|uniref:flippase n=1 Tax=Pseudomonas sp. CCC2.2 TaxID=3048605 RepID=UPI002B232C16|nr:flippase [Pseudomonas sp. CCC2.2]MEB0146557.1 flippase [Pseudomonas sp. CCC2.2]
MSLRKNTLWNLLGSGAPFLLGAITIPFLLNRAGVEVFGILTLVWVLIGYFSLFDFGLGRALTQTVAKKLAGGTVDEVSRIINLGLVMVLVAGLAGGALLAITAIPLGTTWLSVSAVLQHDVVVSLFIASIGIPFTTLTSGLRGVLEAYEEFGKVNVLRVFLGLANFGMPAITVLLWGPVLQWMVASLVLARFVILLAHVFLVHQKTHFFWIYPKSHPEEAKGLITFGSWMTLSNLISPLMVTADRFVISSVVGASLVAYYTVPFEVLIRFLILPAALTAALFPKLSALIAVDVIGAEKLFRKSVLLVASVMLVICSVASMGSLWGMTLWLGQDFARHSWQLASILAVGVLFNSIAQIPHAAVQAAGNVKGTAIVHLVEFCIYFPFLFVFVRYFGLVGAVLIWVMRAFVDMSLMFILAHNVFSGKKRGVVCAVK